MTMTVKKRLWSGFLVNLLVLPLVFGGLMGWSVSSTDTLLATSANLVQQLRLASALRQQLSEARVSGVVGANAAALAAELEQHARGTALHAAATELSINVRGAVEAGATRVAGIGANEPLARAERAAENLVTAGWREYDANQGRMGEIKKTTVGAYGAVLPLTILVALAASLLISRSIIQPLEQLTRAAGKMAGGDLREAVPIPADAELRALAESFNQMRERLAEVILRLKSHAQEVAASTTSVSAASTQMADGARQQSVATEETSSAMEEIAAQIQGVSRNAVELANDTGSAASTARQIGAAAESLLRAAQDVQGAVERAGRSVEDVASTAEASVADLRNVDEFARRINGEAESGGQALDVSIGKIQAVGEASAEASRAFESLGQRSRQINSIVETMVEIADQTSLLALNAAIEAARAGDSGRGFAVVAEEVRKLSDRAASAAKEVSELVGKVREETEGAVLLARRNAQQTEEGARLLAETGGRMRRVVESVQRVSGLVSRVSGAAGEQSRAAGNLKGEVEKLRGLAGILYQAAATQAAGSAQVVEAVQRMSERTRQVADATVQVRAGGEQVLKAVENISVVSRQNQDAAHRVASTMGLLSSRVGELREHVSTLQVAKEAVA